MHCCCMVALPRGRVTAGLHGYIALQESQCKAHGLLLHSYIASWHALWHYGLMALWPYAVDNRLN